MGLPETVGNPIKTNGLRKYSLLPFSTTSRISRLPEHCYKPTWMASVSETFAGVTIERNSTELIRRIVDREVMSGSDFSHPPIHRLVLTYTTIFEGVNKQGRDARARLEGSFGQRGTPIATDSGGGGWSHYHVTDGFEFQVFPRGI